MFDATSPCDARAPTSPFPYLPREAQPLSRDEGPPRSGHLPAASARLDLAFARRDGATRLTGLYQKTPLRAFFPRHECGDLAVAAIANVGGGLVAGDTAAITVDVGPAAAAMVTSQAAEKVYRSTGADCRVETRLDVAEGGWLEWCPQETILFNRARLRRSLRLDLHSGARAMLGETLVLGRLASGERTNRGLLLDRIDVYQAPLLAWTDRLRLEGSYSGLVGAVAGLGGAMALSTFVYAAHDAAALVEPARDLIDADGVRAGVTLVNGLLIARFLAQDPLALRRTFTLFWARFRAATAGLPPILPRLWHV